MQPKLYIITDTSVQKKFSHLQLAEMAIRGGADIIQLRESKKRETGELIKIACAMSALCKKSGATFIVNDRVDIALISDAHGVHLGDEDLPIKEARNILGPSKIIGATAGAIARALELEKQGADYIGFGHIFPTSSKEKPSSPVGISALKEVCTQVKIPVYAIGGIDASNIQQVLNVKPGGIAVIKGVCGADDPEHATRYLKETLHA